MNIAVTAPELNRRGSLVMQRTAPATSKKNPTISKILNFLSKFFLPFASHFWYLKLFLLQVKDTEITLIPHH
jgi:hypothetical protein